MKKKIILGLSLLVGFLGIFAIYLTINQKLDSNEVADTVSDTTTTDQSQTETDTQSEDVTPEVTNVSLTLSFAGDVTMGNYAGSSYSGTFDEMASGQSDDYFLNNVKDVFAGDDLTIVNLEGPLTDASSHLDKTFAFKGDPAYVNILKLGNVDLVSCANNHSEDYYQEGLDDTKAALDSAGIGYFGYESAAVKEIKGIKIGFLGYRSLSLSMNTAEKRAVIANAITDLKQNQGCALVVVYYHWGIESNYDYNADQQSLAHFTIDSGADLIIGSHPHVLQGTEVYNGKLIAYSLGNFCFGGNKNPSDQDSMIYQVKLDFENGSLTNMADTIIPCTISSSTSRNNYQPTLATGAKKDAIIAKIKAHS